MRFLRRTAKPDALAYATRDSVAAAAALAPFPEASRIDGVFFIEDGRLWARSDAALRIARRLRAPWSLLGILRIVPRPVRDRIYDVVARNRYRWFGRLTNE
jgi:predicted DCC family thiol-disulfide oxidoreductase YuxK